MLKINKFFILMLTLEIIFGGGGRLLDPLGVVPVRYVLFALSFVLLGLNIATGFIKCNFMSVMLLIAFVSYPVYGSLMGVINGNSVDDIFFDAQPFIYVLILVYILTLSDDLKNYLTYWFIKIVKFYGVVISFSYIGYIFLLHLGFVNFNNFYSLLSETNEFFFRPSGAFFAKSFFFLGIAAIIFFVEKRYLILLLIMTAILLTETRGVFLFALLGLMAASFKTNRLSVNLFFVFLGVILFTLLLIIVGQRAGDSDSVRVGDWLYYIKHVEALTLIFGSGFGTFILDRLRIEVVPLEILQKTGLIGIALTFIPFFTLIKKGYLAFDNTKINLVLSCCTIFALGVSITNPFLYTPMGIFVTGVVTVIVSSRNNNITLHSKNDFLK